MNDERNQIEICLENPIGFGINDFDGVRIISLKYHNLKRPYRGFRMLKAAFHKKNIYMVFYTNTKYIAFENDNGQNIVTISVSWDFGYLGKVFENRLPTYFTIYDNNNLDEDSMDKILLSSCFVI